MNPVIVTGAQGLLGSHFVPLLAKSRPVVALGRSALAAAVPGVSSVAADLSLPLDRSVLPPAADAIVYLAQSNRFRDFPEGAADMLQVNAVQLVAMLEYARQSGARSFVYASTGGVYGTADEALSEDARVPPVELLGFYPATKYCGELLARNFAPFMTVVILRYFFIYGRGQNRTMLVPRLVDSVREGRPIALQGRDGMRINPIHATDAAAATAAALDLGESATINVAGPEILSIRAIGDTIGAKLSTAPVYDVKAGESPRNLMGDIAKMRGLLGAPVRRFEDGVADML